ncbi:MAG: chemotaxis response regulator protein-glutamate methylesterase [Phycisphaerales bacterium]|nr:chemotaxis response regulator protein-glutamate methylesterase [Phycisphaerales bacterium]
MHPKPIRVLVVDDSVFMRSALKNGLSAAEGFEVIGSAQNGVEGLEKILTLKPDVVTLDVEMPGLTGLEVLERVMKQHPLPIVMVSTKTREGAETTLKALELGAVDYVAKPLGEKSSSLSSFREDIVRAVRAAWESNHRALKPSHAPPRPLPVRPFHDDGAVVAIGISAGGPQTLHKLIPTLPAHFPPLVVTQHMPEDFTGPFARRLNEVSKITVLEAAGGEELRSGQMLLARGDHHLRVVSRQGKLVTVVDKGPKVSGFRPSVDVLLDSVASAAGKRAVGVVMTGMGFDGAAGIRRLKEAGGATIAQDKDTSVVYGMPKAAAETGCVDRVVPLQEIASAIAELISAKPLCVG